VAHNVWIELLLDPAVGRSEYRGFSPLARRKKTFYFVGEFGLLGTASYFVCAIVIIADMYRDTLWSNNL
jgi:hypothetical protein